MLEWLAVNYPTLIVGAAVAAVIAAVITKLVRDKKRHKSSCACGCSCEGCPHAEMCKKYER